MVKRLIKKLTKSQTGGMYEGKAFDADGAAAGPCLAGAIAEDLCRDRHPGASQKELAEYAQKTYAAISQTVKEMLQEDFVRREIDSEDQRYAKLYLTEKGQDYAMRLRAEIGKAEARVRLALPAGKEEEIAALLEQLYEAVRKEQ